MKKKIQRKWQITEWYGQLSVQVQQRSSSDGRRSVWLVHSRAVTNHGAEFSLLIWRVADTWAAPRLTQHLHCEQKTPNNFPPRLICSFSYCRLPATSTRVQFAKCRVQAGNWLSNNLRLILFLPKFLLPYGTLILQVLPALALSNNLTHVIY